MKSGINFVFSIFILTLVSFALFYTMPGSPLLQEVELNPIVRENFEKKWNLNAHILEKYWQTTNNFFQLEFGHSFYHTDQTVKNLVSVAMPQTLKVFAFSFSAFILLVFLGYLFYFSISHKLKNSFNSLLWIFSSWPVLFLAPLVIYLFSFKLDFFHIGTEDFFYYFFMALTLALKPSAQFTLLLIDKTEDLEKSLLMRALKARGLFLRTIYGKHFFKISGLLFFTKFPQIIFHFFVGSFFIEALFSLPGLGDLYFTSIFNRDYPVCVSLTFLYGLFFISLSFLTEFLLKVFDPRLRDL